MADRSMMKMHLKQMDNRLSRLRALPKFEVPKRGWIRELREALAMSARQLAARVGITQSTLAKIEKGEVEKTVSLKTLDRIAEALECHLVYALVPKESLEALIRRQSRLAAEKLVKRVSHSMDLEKQGLPAPKRQAQIDELADEMARTLSKELWEALK